MRFLFIFLLTGLTTVLHSQKKYQCGYTETISFPFPDSLMQTISGQLEEKDLTASLIEKFLSGLKDKGISAEYLRIVNAGPDSTFILTKMNEENEGNIKMNMPSQLLLFHKGEIYQFDSARSGFFPKVDAEASKVFMPNGENRIVMKHTCKGYTSTDSTCTIWIAKDLPSYINPGIRVLNIKGAILAYSLKSMGYNIESTIDKLELKQAQSK